MLPASQVLTLAVTVPLALLMLARAGLGRGQGDRVLARLATAVLLAGTALLAFDPWAVTALSDWAVLAVQVAVILLLATFPDGRFVPRWTALVVAAGVGAQLADAASGFTLQDASWWPWSAWSCGRACCWAGSSTAICVGRRSRNGPRCAGRSPG